MHVFVHAQMLFDSWYPLPQHKIITTKFKVMCVFSESVQVKMER